MKKRKVWLDYARVFAILSISSNHAITRAFAGYKSSYDAYLAFPFIGSVFRAVIFVFSRIGVPVFLMITGSLLLNKSMTSKEDVLHFYKRNLGRLFITSEIWVFISFWFTAIFIDGNILNQGLLYTLRRCIESLLFINQLSVTSMWYIPMILCIYSILPFVNTVVNKYDAKYVLIPCSVVFISSMLIPNINSVFAIFGWDYSLEFGLNSANVFSMYMLYVLAGYYISKDKLKDISSFTLLTGMAGSFALCCVYQIWEYTIPGDHKIGYNFALLMICSGFIFEWFRRFANKEKENHMVTYISKISFGIYFVHIYIMSFMVVYLSRMGLNPVIQFNILEFGSVGASVIAIAVLSKLSILKDYLFLIKE